MRHVANSLVGPFVALLLPLTALAQQDAKRLLLIGQGPDGHKPGTHEFMADVQMLAKLLEPIDALQTTVVNGDEPFADGPKLIDRADVVVLCVSQGARWMQREPARYEALTRLTTRGGGLAALHWSVGAKEGKFIAGQVKLLGGSRGGPHRKYALLETDVKVLDTDHPITRGLSDFHVRDEFYYALDLTPPEQGNRYLLAARIDGNDETCCWAWQRGDGGRSFGYVGFHFHDLWKFEPYRRLVVQGVLWTADVPMPPEGIATEFPGE